MHGQDVGDPVPLQLAGVLRVLQVAHEQAGEDLDKKNRIEREIRTFFVVLFYFGTPVWCCGQEKEYLIISLEHLRIISPPAVEGRRPLTVKAPPQKSKHHSQGLSAGNASQIRAPFLRPKALNVCVALPPPLAPAPPLRQPEVGNGREKWWG